MSERDELVSRLAAVSYYRLAGYLHPFRSRDASGLVSERFIEGTTLSAVWDRYCFDGRLRGLVLDAIERIEVSMRTKLVYHFSHTHGPFGYLDSTNLPKLTRGHYDQFIDQMRRETKRSRETFKEHFFEKYGDEHRDLPLWMAAELMSMGNLLTLLRGVAPELKRTVASEYGYSDRLLFSWFGSLYVARNICAHHGRLWNRGFGYAPLIPPPNKFPHWHKPEIEFHRKRTGLLLLICRFWLRTITPTSNWAVRVEALFAEYPRVPVKDMGRPDDWNQHPVWAGS